MKIRFAFVGFRHSHIFDLLEGVRSHPDCTVVAQCEEDAAARESLKSRADVAITHSCFETMLKEAACDVIAIGDYYTRRGSLAIRALEAGKHVIADKPLCCTLAELERIEALSARSGLSVGCQFDLRGSGPLITLGEVLRTGELGQVHTISFSGQHPLLPGVRPAWYFEPGCHGGTINDIAIHAMDAIPWMTGRTVAEVTAARAWNAKTPQFPHFQDSAQMMLRLDNGGGVLGDVSYLAPDGCGYDLPQYWRFIIHGSNGVAETCNSSPTVLVATHGDKSPRAIGCEPGVRRPYLPDFLTQVQDPRATVSLSTGDVLRAARTTLTIQAAADANQTRVACR